MCFFNNSAIKTRIQRVTRRFMWHEQHLGKGFKTRKKQYRNEENDIETRSKNVTAIETTIKTREAICNNHKSQTS